MTTENQETENAENATETGEATQETTSQSVAGSGDDGGSSEGGFDASSYEESFGLPADTLKGVEDAESALEVVREYTDKTLTAGLLSAPTSAAPQKVEESSNADETGSTGKAATSGNAELDALRAEFAEVKEKLVTREKNDYQQRAADLDRRVDAEINSWASPKYGTTKSRNYKQAQSILELQSSVTTYVRGAQAEGRAGAIDVEKMLRQVRAFHDDTYKPAAAEKNGNASLGSPGTGSRSTKKDDSGPSNIHQALMNNDIF